MFRIMSIVFVLFLAVLPGFAADKPTAKPAPQPTAAPEAQPPAPAPIPGLETEEKKTFYALGLAIAQNLAAFNPSEEELKITLEGISDSLVLKNPKIEITEYGPKIQNLYQARMSAAVEAEKKSSEAFLESAAAEPGAEKLPSGMIYRELKAGTGPNPTATSQVKVHYHGTLRDGSVFDSSVERGDPATFRLNQVIPCWTEGVAKIKVGGKAKLTCPASVAYGDRGYPPKIKGGAVLTFDVELLEILPEPTPPPAPPSAPPAPTPPPATEPQK